MRKNNIALIGMPGSGKSTVGVVLAKNLGLAFLDSDICIQEQEKQLLYQIIEKKSIEGFLEIENEVNANLQIEDSILATGGSVVYGKEAMEHLKEIATIIYLELDYDSICERLGDFNERGVVLKKTQTLLDLFQEREPLYQQYADRIINCCGKSIRDIVLEISKVYVTLNP